MPEGDAVFRAAIRLRADLQGAPLSELFVRHRGVIESAAGAGILAIETRGKHTLIHIERPDAAPALALHIHLGMNGSWRRYRAGAPCLVCGEPVSVRRHSEQARKTYFCRGCQIESPRAARVS